MSDTEQSTAFVLTHGPSHPQRDEMTLSIIALTISRSLGRKKIPVVHVHPNYQDFSLSTKYCTAVERCPDLYESKADLLQFLLQLASRYPGQRVLFPASDDCAQFVSQYRKQLSAVFSLPAPPKKVMDKIVDKKRQYREAKKLGIPIPETYYPKDESELHALAGKAKNFPYVVKPNVAHKWRHESMQTTSKGQKGFVVRNPQELIQSVEQVWQQDQNIMVQEVIGGRDERLFTFLSYLNEQSEPLGYCIRKKIRQNPPDFGYCTLTVSCFDQRVLEQSLRLLQAIEFQGISGVEWKLDPKTDQLKLIEINGRAVNTTGIAPACGVDLPYIAFQDMAGQPVAKQETYARDVKWIWLSADLWAVRSLFRSGDLTVAEWWRSVKGLKTDAVFAFDDLRPSLQFYYSFARDTVKNAVHKRLKAIRPSG